MDLSSLKAELDDDPLGLGYAEMTEAQRIASLNARTRSVNRVLPSSELLAWSGINGRISKLRKAAEGEAPYTLLSDDVRAVAIAAYKLVSRPDTSFDKTAEGRAAMLDALVAAGVFTADDRADLLARTVTLVSRAQELGLPEIGIGYIRTCGSTI